jgi:hypothetical protein
MYFLSFRKFINTKDNLYYQYFIIFSIIFDLIPIIFKIMPNLYLNLIKYLGLRHENDISQSINLFGKTVYKIILK